MIRYVKLTCKSATKPPLNTHGSCSPLIKLSFHPLENPKMYDFIKIFKYIRLKDCKIIIHEKN